MFLSRALKETWSHEGNMMYFHPAHNIITLLSFMLKPSPLNMQETFINGVFHQKWRPEVLIMLVRMAKIATGMWGNCLRFKLWCGQINLKYQVPLKFFVQNATSTHKIVVCKPHFWSKSWMEVAECWKYLREREGSHLFLSKIAWLAKLHSQSGKELQKCKAVLSLVHVSIPGIVHSHTGWGLKQPHLVEGAPAHDRGVGLDDF